MAGALDDLTEDDIRELASPAVFTRGEDYFAEGRVRPGRREAGGLTSEVQGTRLYEVRIREARWGLIVDCTCPYAWSRACKHGVATLLAWLHEPAAFAAVED